MGLRTINFQRELAIGFNNAFFLSVNQPTSVAAQGFWMLVVKAISVE